MEMENIIVQAMRSKNVKRNHDGFADKDDGILPGRTGRSSPPKSRLSCG